MQSIVSGEFSAALCRGLIEAAFLTASAMSRWLGFPRLYAAASLKHLAGDELDEGHIGFPRLYAAASLKRFPQRDKV